jgi:hypothetical protein
MPKRRDESQIAFDTLQEMIERDAKRDSIPQKPKPKPEKISYRVKAGRKGGKIGGKIRAEKLTAKKRKQIARKAAKSRWRDAK